MQILTYYTSERVRKGTTLLTGGIECRGEYSKEECFSKFKTPKLSLKLIIIAR